jgi:hypothetical protein
MTSGATETGAATSSSGSRTRSPRGAAVDAGATTTTTSSGSRSIRAAAPLPPLLTEAVAGQRAEWST